MPIHTFTQQAARFADVHGIAGCAGDGVHNVGGAASELSLWAGKRDKASLLDQRAGCAPGRIAEKVAAVSRLFLCFGRVLTSKSIRFEGRR